MDKAKRKAIIAGNWKMNKTASEAAKLVDELIPAVKDASCEVVICTPFTDLVTAVEKTKGTNIHVGAENVHFEKSGAFTGEISADMLVDLGVEYVIVGHSERRQYFAETDQTVNKRALAALNAGLKVIICVGESLQQREEGVTEELVRMQTKIALRDVTATVDSIPLIASSIMSKKLAAGSDAIVLDVKVGDGAFMENEQDAETLANLMVDIGDDAGRRTVAAITEMGQPLGCAVGNSLEVIEAIETLKGKGPEDITELAERLAGIMVYLGGKAQTPEEGHAMAAEALASGKGLAQFRKFAQAQGGNPAVVDDYTLFPQAAHRLELTAEADGYVQKIAARTIGLASQHTGAGRATKENQIDLAAGVYLHKKVGDAVKKGEILATFYGNDPAKLENGRQEASKAFAIGAARVEHPKLIKKIIGL